VPQFKIGLSKRTPSFDKFFSKREHWSKSRHLVRVSDTLPHTNIVHSVVRVVDSNVVGETFMARIPLSRRARLSRNFFSTIEANFPMEILLSGAFMSDPLLPARGVQAIIPRQETCRDAVCAFEAYPAARPAAIARDFANAFHESYPWTLMFGATPRS
jgi:hypothetical protein